MSADLRHAHEWDTADTQQFVGLGLGRDELFLYEFKDEQAGQRQLGFDTADTVRCFDYSPTQQGLVGYGFNSGNACVRELGPNDTQLQLKSRATRRCNGIAFSVQGNVATAYERTKNNDSVCIWDLKAESASTPLSTVPVTETVHAMKFVPQNAQSLVYGASKHLGEFDLRSGQVVGTLVTALSSYISFSPLNSNLFVTFGEASHLALWDRRMIARATSSADQQHSEPLLLMSRVFKESAKLDARCVRFSLDTECELAVLQDGSLIRRWQTSVTPDDTPQRLQSSQLTTSLTKESGSNELLSAPSPQSRKRGNSSTQSDALDVSLFVNKVYDLRTEIDKVVSFDYAWNTRFRRPEMVCIRQSGTIFRMPVTHPPASIYFDPFNDLQIVTQSSELIETTKPDHSQIVASDLGSKDVRLLRDTQADRKSASIVPVSSNLSGAQQGELDPESDSEENSEEESEADDGMVSHVTNDTDAAASSAAPHTITVHDDVNGLQLDVLLSNDITTTMRLRALAGYSLDAARNIELFSSTQPLTVLAQMSPESQQILQATSGTSTSILAAWKWIALQQTLMNQPNNYLETPEIDLRYIGVSSIWDGLINGALKSRVWRGNKIKVSSKTVDGAVKYAVKQSPGSAYVQSAGNDDDNAYRQLCLRLSGWDFGLNELESRLLELEEQGKYEKAAGWAAFHNNVERAVESLAKSGRKNLRLMSTAVAGYLVYKDIPTNNLWREQCRRLASELSAPYLRAIFAYISDGSWLDVLDDGSLPLTERLGIALRFLPSKEVGKYLSTLTARAITNGDLEGIILTGFTPKVLDLMQAYIDRTSDVQTVCLLVSYGWPRFVDHPLFPKWLSEYRQLLNSWQYFSQRARLDIVRNKLVLKYSQVKPPITGQAFLKCSHCKQNITWCLGEKSGSKKTNKKNADRNGDRVPQLWNRCPCCNHQLPPCAVCTNALGPSIDDELESDRWPTFCLKCNHAFHSVHARQWFQKYEVCAVPSCSCLCSRTVSFS